MNDIIAVTAFEIWWLTKPNQNTPAPKDCGISQDDAMSIWLNAWRFNNNLPKEKSWESHF